MDFCNSELIQYFQSKFTKGNEKDCWVWQGAFNQLTPIVNWKKKKCSALGLAFFVANHVKPGKSIRRSCNNFTCVNPAHLYLVTDEMLSPRYIDRFWKGIVRGVGATCWEWVGRKHWGYGFFKYGRKTVKAHRFSFMLHGGILDGDKPFVLHKCNNRGCCNPSHLYAGNQKQNMRDKYTAGTQRGENHPQCKLSSQDITDIRESSATISTLAKEYMMSESYMWQIKKFKARVDK